MSRREAPLTIEYLLLGLIGEEPVYAYSLHKRLTTDPELRTLWYFNQSQLYAVLDKIDRNGLVSSEMDNGEAYPLRKIYSLTEKGRDVFETWLHTPVKRVNQMRSDFLAKLYFLRTRPLEEYQKLIDEQISLAEGWQKDFLFRQVDQSEGSGFFVMVTDFRYSIASAVVSWLKRIRSSKE